MYGPKISTVRFLSSRRSGVPVKPMNVASGRIASHRVVEVARLGSVALVDEDEEVALGARSPCGSARWSSAM